MHERIKQLADDAGFELVQCWGKADKDSLEKFYELLIKECAVFIVNDDYRGVTLAERLKKHFRVEE